MNIIKKTGILFIALYLFLYMFPFPFDHIPLLNFVSGCYAMAFDQLVIAIGTDLLGIKDLANGFNGSGDTTFEYVKVLCILLISALLSVILIIILRNRIKTGRAMDLVLLYARYYVGLYMLFYGFAKIFEGQFSFPAYGKLEQPLGHSSPMGLLWTFMGFSKPYTLFGGLLELLAGYLILFRRTKTVGALLTLAVMINVAMLNFCYDVPVKLFSTHLILLSLIVIIADLKQLYNFFILHVPSELPTPTQVLEMKYPWIPKAIKTLLIGSVSIITVYEHLDYSSEYSWETSQTLDGTYSTKLFVLGKDTLPPLTTDSLRWKSLVIWKGISKLTKMTDSVERFNVKIDHKAKAIDFVPQTDLGSDYKLSYREKDGNFVMNGKWKGKDVYAIFSKKTYNDYRLTSRGFHWINEEPFNR